MASLAWDKLIAESSGDLTSNKVNTRWYDAQDIQIFSKELYPLQKILFIIVSSENLKSVFIEFHFFNLDLQIAIVSLSFNWLSKSIIKNLKIAFRIAPNLY